MYVQLFKKQIHLGLRVNVQLGLKDKHYIYFRSKLLHMGKHVCLYVGWYGGLAFMLIGFSIDCFINLEKCQCFLLQARMKFHLQN